MGAAGRQASGGQSGARLEEQGALCHAHLAPQPGPASAQPAPWPNNPSASTCLAAPLVQLQAGDLLARARVQKVNPAKVVSSHDGVGCARKGMGTGAGPARGRASEWAYGAGRRAGAARQASAGSQLHGPRWTTCAAVMPASAPECSTSSPMNVTQLPAPFGGCEQGPQVLRAWGTRRSRARPCRPAAAHSATHVGGPTHLRRPPPPRAASRAGWRCAPWSASPSRYQTPVGVGERGWAAVRGQWWEGEAQAGWVARTQHASV